ncbi:MAG: rRNA pseudouridine synthase [Alphaproteobacteria bacterium]|nr:rRNA pseudouridine synthase [Alphaproteobacteria bacterium]
MDHETQPGERIAKVMARRGACSRRMAETWITAGRVQVNGQVLTTPAFVVTDTDEILIDGKPLPQKAETRLWLYHKAKGLVTTHSDPEGRLTVFDTLPPHLPRVISVGRLDQYSEGLLLLTNDGAFSRLLELPRHQIPRTYHVRIFGRISARDMHRLERGMVVDEVQYGPTKIRILNTQGDNTWIEMTLWEGKNREIRKLMEAVGVQVNRLKRIAYGPFSLEDLEVGDVYEVPQAELTAFLKKMDAYS